MEDLEIVLRGTDTNRTAIIRKTSGKVYSEITLEDFWDMIRSQANAYRELMAFYRCAAMEIETKFKVLDEHLSLEREHNPIESIRTRLKSPESIVEKMKRKGIPMDLRSLEAEIQDIAGVRVICSFPDDIYFLADCLLKQDDIKLIEKRDYIKHPKPGGYRSLHLIVEVPIFLKNEKRMMKVEVQLRTIAMDFWASLEHKLRYKKNVKPEIMQMISEDLVDCAYQIECLDTRMQEIRDQIENIEN